MADEIIKRDENYVTALAGITDDVNQEIKNLLVDPVTGALKVTGDILLDLDIIYGGITLTDNPTSINFEGNVEVTATGDAVNVNVLGGGGSGDMTKAVYDPTNVGGDAFDMDNMVQGTTNKFVSSAELTVIQNTSGTNTGDQVLPTRDSLGLDTDDSPQFAGINLGHASDTTLSRSSAGVLAVEGVVIPSISSTDTLTNKRITPRVTTITSHATPTINTDNCDAVTITAQAEAITSMTTNLSGTPTNFQRLLIRIKDDGTARAITWGPSFQSGSATLPGTTVAGKTLMVGLIHDSVDSKWTCEATGSRA